VSRSAIAEPDGTGAISRAKVGLKRVIQFSKSIDDDALLPEALHT
jgi:hypothetical protein